MEDNNTKDELVKEDNIEDEKIEINSTTTNGKALVSMVLGIVALVLSFIPYGGFVGIPAAIVGLVFAIKAKKEIAATGAPGKGMAHCWTDIRHSCFGIRGNRASMYVMCWCYDV